MTKNKTIIRTSKHTTKFSNKSKNDNLCLFIDECRRVLSLMIDHAWDNGLSWNVENKNTGEIGEYNFSIENNLLTTPSYIDYKLFNIDTFLTARALSSLATQMCGMIGSAVEKQRKRLYTYKKMKSEGVSKSKLKPLIKNIKNNIPQKPNCANVNIELSSKCIDWQDDNGEFIGFLKLKSITKSKIQNGNSYPYKRT